MDNDDAKFYQSRMKIAIIGKVTDKQTEKP